MSSKIFQIKKADLVSGLPVSFSVSVCSFEITVSSLILQVPDDESQEGSDIEADMQSQQKVTYQASSPDEVKTTFYICSRKHVLHQEVFTRNEIQPVTEIRTDVILY